MKTHTLTLGRVILPNLISQTFSKISAISVVREYNTNNVCGIDLQIWMGGEWNLVKCKSSKSYNTTDIKPFTTEIKCQNLRALQWFDCLIKGINKYS